MRSVMLRCHFLRNPKTCISPLWATGLKTFVSLVSVAFFNWPSAHFIPWTCDLSTGCGEATKDLQQNRLESDFLLETTHYVPVPVATGLIWSNMLSHQQNSHTYLGVSSTSLSCCLVVQKNNMSHT